jgi:predicted kinase
MRKWMRDKLKRRKKSQEEAATGPAPLQPAYFAPEPESATAEPQGKEMSEASDEASSQRDASIADESSVGLGAAEQGAEPARRPRRRRRGGRGRKRPGQQRTANPAPSSGSSELGEGAAGRADNLPSHAVPSAPVAAAAATQSPTKGVVVLAVGLPGSGKSSWFKRHNIVPLSSDVLRTMLFDDPAEQRFQDLVFSNLRSMLKARLISRRPMNYVDATNLTPHERHNWIKLAKDFGYEAQAVFFDVPLEVCIERHNRRDRTVPEDVMRKMSARLKAPTFEEGFSKITVVRVKQRG